MLNTVRSEHENRKPKIGLDTFSVRLYFQRAPKDAAKWPTLPDGFTLSAVRERPGWSEQTFYDWHANHPALKIFVNAHELELWTHPDEEDPVCSGKFDITFEVARVKSSMMYPDAPFWVNDKTCSSSEAGSIVKTIIEEIAEALQLGEYTVEVLRIDVFADVVCPDHRTVLDHVARRRPKVYKTQAQPATYFNPWDDDDDPTGGVTHRRYKGGKKGCEETRLYPRAPKLLKDLEAAGLEAEIEPSSALAQTLRLEAVHGKERKSGCRPLKICDDFTARPTRSGDEDSDEIEGKPSISLEDALDPRVWAGVLLERLRELDLYGKDARSIEVALSPSDLRKRLLAAGVSRGTASQYADIVFEGEEILRAEGCDTRKIIKKVESIMGRTFVAEHDRLPHDPFADIASACLELARAGGGPDPSTWTRLRILSAGETANTAPHGSVTAPVGQRDPLDPDDLREVEAAMDEIDNANPSTKGKGNVSPQIVLEDARTFDPYAPPKDTARPPPKKRIGKVRGRVDQTNETLVKPMPAGADSVIVGQGSADWRNDPSLISVPAPPVGVHKAPDATSNPTKPNRRKRKADSAQADPTDRMLEGICNWSEQ
ncbi:hypothetical protein [Nannocystis pusilla]|uniref:Uncharacterized protein n=1 Tax=Nannocystis pusilla TaxID=889268 RepID=A0ABS7U423_9BACT|nr:hypothetical protein [Nannocystis pusilla]MBZ5715283.1 hypothetical protein [Nannocystis pusilla]